MPPRRAPGAADRTHPPGQPGFAGPSARPSGGPASDDDLDLVLVAQIAVAHASETSPDDPRLGWCDSDLASEFGGADLFRRLYPTTWRWALVRALREAARASDALARKRASDPDRVVTLFHFGPALDGRLDERLDALEALHPKDPTDALPALADLTAAPWSRDRFTSWLGPPAAWETTSIGRRLHHAPDSLAALVAALLGALTPLPERDPVPHVEVARP